mmetsp:Transcript_23461/g.80637  ORF Transcript_23461/g.80637 Transcript_23461/m.80637 type:complete len:217 (+) Transcript_23461:115-765(+)
MLPAKLTAKKKQLAERRKCDQELNVAANDNVVDDSQQTGWSLSLEIAALETEINDTKQLEEGPLVITIKDLDHALRTLGRQCTKKQLEYMIWEVDENLDGEINWDEFKMMYHRNVTDETGLEPFELFNIVQFMTYLPSLKIDKDFKAQITEDDTMSTLFARYGHDQTYGRVHVERLMTKLFGDKLKAEKGEGVLSLDEYLRVVGVRNYARKRSAGV